MRSKTAEAEPGVEMTTVVGLGWPSNAPVHSLNANPVFGCAQTLTSIASRIQPDSVSGLRTTTPGTTPGTGLTKVISKLTSEIP